MRLKVISISSAFWLLFSVIGFSQIDTTWIKTYGGNRDDKAYDIIHTQDSGFLIIGSTSSFGLDNAQMYFLKLDSTGAIIWSKSHGGSNQEAGYSVIQTMDGGYLGVGHTNSWGSGGFDLLMVKLDASGNTIFEKYFGGTDWDFAYDVIETHPNIFVMAGETQSFGSGGKDAWIVRYDANNDLFDWNHTYGDVGTDDYKSITKAPTGGFYAAGRGVQPNHTDEDVMVTRFDDNGDTLWNKYYGDTLQDFANEITSFSDNSVVFAGRLTTEDSTKTYVVKLSSADTTIWEDRLINTKNATGISVIERPDGNPAVFSQIFNHSLGYEFWYVFMGYNGSGTMGTLANDVASKILLDNHGKYLMLGYTNGFGSNYNDFLLYRTKEGKYNPDNFKSLKDTVNILNTIKLKDPSEISYIYSNNILTFSQKKRNNNILSIYDITGKLILKEYFSERSFEISVVGLLKGIYILRISDYEGLVLKTFKIPL